MTALDDILAGEADVEVRRTPVGVIIAIVIAAGLVLGGLAAGAIAFGVTVSHTEQGLCGSLGVPCTSLSVERVGSLSGLSFPAGTEVTGAHYNRTPNGTTFWATVVLPVSAGDPLANTGYESIGIPVTAREQRWEKGKRSLTYLGEIDGNVTHSAVEGRDRAGHRALYLSFTSGP